MSDIKVPELGESIIDGTLTSWLVSEGSSFNVGDNLAEIETEKITIEIPAQSAGLLKKILVQEGSNVKVGEIIAQYDEGDIQSSIEKSSQTQEKPKLNPQPKKIDVEGSKVSEDNKL